MATLRMKNKHHPRRPFVYLDERSKRALKYIAYSNGLSMSDVLKIAVNEFIYRMLPNGWKEVRDADQEFSKYETRHSENAKKGSRIDSGSRTSAQIREIRSRSSGAKDV